MRRTSFADWPCSIARTADVVGDPWVLLILREAFRGATRFDGFEERLGIARNTLTQRLGRLVEEGILEKVAYQEHPERFDYRLTESGQDLYAVLAAMLAWGDRWRAPDGPPVVLTHETCGHDTSAVVVCDHCREPLRPEHTAMRFAGSTRTR